MKTLGLIQPAWLSNIITVLPIGQHFHRLGYQVLWPVMGNLYEQLREVAPEIKWCPTTCVAGQAVPAATRLVADCDKLLNLATHFMGNEQLTADYQDSGLILDAWKYKKARVPFKEKYVLHLQKPHQTNVNDDYCVACATNEWLSLCRSQLPSMRVIDLWVDHQPNIFKMMDLIQNAKGIATTDNAICRLVNQMGWSYKWQVLLGELNPTYTLSDEWHTCYDILSDTHASAKMVVADMQPGSTVGNYSGGDSKIHQVFNEVVDETNNG